MNSEEDMTRFYLSNKLNASKQNNIDEFEILLETYEQQIKEDVGMIIRLIKEIEALLRLANINLAYFRNRIAIFNSKINILRLSITFGAFIASLFGMNLNNSLEQKNGGFYIGSLIISFLSFLVFLYIKKYLNNMV